MVVRVIRFPISRPVLLLSRDKNQLFLDFCLNSRILLLIETSIITYIMDNSVRYFGRVDDILRITAINIYNIIYIAYYKVLGARGVVYYVWYIANADLWLVLLEKLMTSVLPPFCCYVCLIIVYCCIIVLMAVCVLEKKEKINNIHCVGTNFMMCR